MADVEQFFLLFRLGIDGPPSVALPSARAALDARHSQTVTTVGYGWPQPMTDRQRIEAMFFIVFGMHGLPPISIIGLGLVLVSSLMRVPNPPANITAFIITPRLHSLGIHSK